MQSMPALGSDDVIECLVEAISRPGAAIAEKTLLREALHSLVRLAQAEQLLRMQLDFNQLTVPPASQVAMPNRAG
jgi:hypothetical protein